MGTGSVVQAGVFAATNRSKLEEGTPAARAWAAAVLEALGAAAWRQVALRQMSGVVVLLYVRWGRRGGVEGRVVEGGGVLLFVRWGGGVGGGGGRRAAVCQVEGGWRGAGCCCTSGGVPGGAAVCVCGGGGLEGAVWGPAGSGDSATTIVFVPYCVLLSSSPWPPCQPCHHVTGCCHPCHLQVVTGASPG
jgi:hypothetical protein